MAWEELPRQPDVAMSAAMKKREILAHLGLLQSNPEPFSSSRRVSFKHDSQLRPLPGSWSATVNGG